MAVTESSTTQTTEDAQADTPSRLFGPRGRHRRPRPRKVLLAAGGLALAVGALSLVRLTPESGLGGLATPESEPWLNPSGDRDPVTDRATNTAATVGTAAPRVSPSATSVMGGLGATPTAPPPLVPATPTITPSSPLDPATTITEAPSTTAPAQPPATKTAAPQQPPATAPTPAPGKPANTPSPQPSPSPSDDDGPGVCVPIIGLCVDPLTKHDD